MGLFWGRTCRRALLLAVIALMALTVVSAASAYTKPAPGGSYVGVVGCWKDGGTTTVPAGSPFTVFAGWTAKTKGLVHDWLNGSTNTLSIDGGPAIDMSPYFLGLTDEWTPTSPWSDIFFYQVGTLAVGQSVNVGWTIATEHPITDGITPGVAPPGSFTFTCTVTGA